MLPPTHRSPDNAAFANDLATGKAQGRTQELVAQRSDGRQFPVEVSIAEFGSGEQAWFRRDCARHFAGTPGARRTEAHACAGGSDRERTARNDRHAEARAGGVAGQAGGHAGACAACRCRCRGRSRPRRLLRAPVHRRAPWPSRSRMCAAIRSAGSPPVPEKLGLGFRYEDNELNSTSLIGDPAPSASCPDRPGR